MKYSLESRLSKLCVGCGACQAVCPRNAINLFNKNGFVSLQINRENCSGCGLCSKICPIVHAAFHEPAVFSEKEMVGHYHKIYISYASDDKIRWRGASGGVITALIINMLKAGLIDGALVSRMKKPSVVDAHIVRNVKEVLESQGSIYFPTYAARQMKNIRANDGSYAVVGLPCHIAAFKRSENYFPNLAKKIFVYLGLFCYHVNEFWYLDYFIKKTAKMKPEEVLEVSPRRNGWPGSIQIRSAREEKGIPFFSFWSSLQLLYLTSPIGCLFCSDHTNLMADLSFGDAWLPSIMKTDSVGRSLVIARTKKGLSLLREAEDDGSMILREITIKDLLESQRSIFYKKKFVSAARALMQKQMKFSPKKCVELLPLMHANITRNRIIRNLVYAFPKNVLEKYAHLLHRLTEDF